MAHNLYQTVINVNLVFLQISSFNSPFNFQVYFGWSNSIPCKNNIFYEIIAPHFSSKELIFKKFPNLSFVMEDK